MKNTLFLCSIILCTLFSKAQGPQIAVTVPYNTWSAAKVKGWLYLPSDYATTTKNYPVVVFYHGLGEAGTDPALLLSNGIPKLIAGGMRPDNITNPVDGKKYSFIVLSVQHWSWSPDPAWLPFQLKWLKANYRIDTNRVYVTGMSAGGQQSFRAASNNESVSKLIAAAVPMSPANVADYNPSFIDQNKIETWFFSGNSDGNYTQNATTYSTQCNMAYPGSSKLNIYTGGHCCWNTYYNTSWDDPTTGLSVWEWMLQFSNETTKILPVNFLGIEARKNGPAVQVNWKVSDEKEVSHYEVEKSMDGQYFLMTGSVVAEGKDAYSYIDEEDPSHFYRVKSVDLDGSIKYSPVARFKGIRPTMVLRAFPVPAINEITIQHPVSDRTGKVVIHGIDGRLMQSMPVKEGSQQTSLDISGLNAGAYFVRYVNANESSDILKITKQ